MQACRQRGSMHAVCAMLCVGSEFWCTSLQSIMYISPAFLAVASVFVHSLRRFCNCNWWAYTSGVRSSRSSQLGIFFYYLLARMLPAAAAAAASVSVWLPLVTWKSSELAKGKRKGS